MLPEHIDWRGRPARHGREPHHLQVLGPELDLIDLSEFRSVPLGDEVMHGRPGPDQPERALLGGGRGPVPADLRLLFDFPHEGRRVDGVLRRANRDSEAILSQSPGGLTSTSGPAPNPVGGGGPARIS